MSLLDRWNLNPNRKPVRANSAQLAVQPLDDRIVPSHSWYTAGPATHFEVLAPETTTVGDSKYIEVVALDASNHIATGYTGTVDFTSSDGNATLPADYTFTSSDRGVHAFKVSFATTGSDTVTATDSATATITGSSTVTVDAAPVATHFLVLAQRGGTYAGVASQVTVVALDASNHVVRNYSGTVSLTSTDAGATLPATYTFTASDQGVHTFSVTQDVAGTYTTTATDTTTAGITGSVSVTVTAAPVATHLAVIRLRGFGQYGSDTAEYAVVALDANNRVVPNYTGTVAFTSDDAGATLPANYTFTAADNGVHLFSVTFSSTGTQDLTATDTTTASITGTASAPISKGRFWM